MSPPNTECHNHHFGPITKPSVRCYLCRGQLRGTNRVIQICSKHRFSTARERHHCVAAGCRKYPKRCTSLYCFRHDKRKQQERNLPRFLRNIDDVFEQQRDDTSYQNQWLANPLKHLMHLGCAHHTIRTPLPSSSKPLPLPLAVPIFSRLWHWIVNAFLKLSSRNSKVLPFTFVYRQMELTTAMPFYTTITKLPTYVLKDHTGGKVMPRDSFSISYKNTLILCCTFG